jgi:hypothetical protein
MSEPLEAGDTFPFLRLPAELRLHIYRICLKRDGVLTLHLQKPEEKENPSLQQGEEKDGPSNASSIVPTLYGDISRNNDIAVALLRTCTLIYKEARQVLYAENTFTLLLPTGIPTLSLLHQRSRSLIKSVTVTVPSHHDILDGFADLVRLGLRYCWGLKRLTVTLEIYSPDDRTMTNGSTSVNGKTSVYASAFHILRFLPKGCKVLLEGNVSEAVKQVVVEEGRLLDELDELSHLKRQHQMPDVSLR